MKTSALTHVFLGVTIGIMLLGLHTPAGAAVTGDLQVEIRDAEGYHLPGATVAIRGPAQPGERATVTRERGVARFNLLTPGVYEIRVSMPGYATVVHDDVQVTLDETRAVKINLPGELTSCYPETQPNLIPGDSTAPAQTPIAVHRPPISLRSANGNGSLPLADPRHWRGRIRAGATLGSEVRSTMSAIALAARRSPTSCSWPRPPASRESGQYDFVARYNGDRPHGRLVAQTPDEVCFGRPPACLAPRFEPRRRWPRGSPCARPHTEIDGRRGARLELAVNYRAGRKHLPVVQLRRVA